MSLVRPFRARIYSPDAGRDLSTRIAPPYDVVTAEGRAELLSRDPFNAVALELPEGPLDPSLPGNRYETGRTTWQSWLQQGVLVDDGSPAIYVLEQDWMYEGRPCRRRGFIAAVRLHPLSAGVVLPHERTLPRALTDRLNLTRATCANLSQVFGLFTDPDCASAALLDTATAAVPLFTAHGSDGVFNSLWAIRDPEAIAAVVNLIGEGPIFIADGHHRYTTALAYRDERRAADAEAGTIPPDPAYDFVMMALVNMDDPELLVLPMHRLARSEGAFDAAAFWAAVAEHFDLADIVPEPHPKLDPITDTTSFIVKTSDGTTRLATLRADVDPAAAIQSEHTDAWKRLDVTVLQELVLRPIFGIDPDDPATLDRLSFVKDAAEALQVRGADVAFVVAPTRMVQLRNVALAGETMPQKSTYFYPKLASGLLYRPLD